MSVSHVQSLTSVLDLDLIFNLLNVTFCTAQDGTVLMFPTFLQIILDLYRIRYIRVWGLSLLRFRCMRLICCLSEYLLEMVRQHCPVGFLGLMYKRLSTIWGFFVCFLLVFFVFFALFFVYLGTIYIINK